jgi:hypothetical protein
VSGGAGMTQKQNVTFQEAIDIVESLPQYQQQDLIDIVQRRMIEQKRESLAKHIREARADYQKGQVKQGSVDDLLKDLTEC